MKTPEDAAIESLTREVIRLNDEVNVSYLAGYGSALAKIKNLIQTEIHEWGVRGGIPTSNLTGLQRAIQIIEELRIEQT